MPPTRRLVAFLSALLLLPLIAATTSTAAAAPAAGGELFRPLSGFDLGRSDDARVQPTAYRAFRSDLGAIRNHLSGGGAHTIAVPAPTGELPEFTVVEDSVMAPELQAAHPEIRTYAGHGPEGSSIRLDVTPMGFHAMVRNADGVTWYVDPARNRLGEDRVLSYLGASVPEPEQEFVEHGLERTAHRLAAGQDQVAPTPGGIVSSRTYRLAFITDKSYADQFGPDDAGVFAEKTTLINRVNEVYNDDLAIKFEMVPGTDTKLNLDTEAEQTGTNGPCGATACYTTAQLAGCGGALLTRNIFVLGQLIGAENYDIGHIGLGKSGGGIAGLGVVGGPSKARGCTGVGPPTTGDLFAIDYVAHEIGHQMGADHTFNGTQANCSPGNRNDTPFDTQVEPGSGSSIMAYAGICATDNLQPHSDPYFSFVSVDEINATTAQAPTTDNEQQVVNLKDFDGTDAFTLTCGGCGTSATVTNGSSYNILGVAAAVLAATGQAGVVSGLDANGFTVDWSLSTADIPTLVVTPVSGTFTTFTGTIYNGGPTDEQGDVDASTNHSPVVTVPAAKTIPTRTPFTLTGSATDPDGDALTYLWEQTDAGGATGTGLVDNTKTNGPLFRQFGTAAIVSATDTRMYDSAGENLADGNPSRTFPDLAQILANNTNAETGTCPAAPANPPVPQATVDCYSEFLPTSAWVGRPTSPRVLHFRLTARDRFTGTSGPGAVTDGGLSSADMTLTVAPTAGPFLVTSQATAAPASGTELVTWNVAGTDAASMAPNVKISLSTDGGLTYPTVLVASTPNDGSEPVLLPNVTTSTARIKVEAVDNYFFDINAGDFEITPVGGNQAPLVDAGPDVTLNLGTPFVRSGSFADDSGGTPSATVDYGDGAGPEPLALTGTTFELDHTYTTAGPKTVTVSVTDSDGAVGTDTVTVTVNGPPTVNAGPDRAATVGAPFTSSGSFTDESPGTASATVDYGDGLGPQPLPLSGTSFTLNRTYTSTGARTVTVKVTDSGGLSATDTMTVTVGQHSSTVEAKAKPKKITKGRAFKVKATVTAGVVPAGVVEVYRGTKLLGTGTLEANGKVTIKISKRKARKLQIGKNTLTAKYLGSASVAASQVDFTIKVKKRN